MEHDLLDNLHDKIMYSLGEITGELKGIRIQLEKINGRLDNHGERLDNQAKDMEGIKVKAAIFGSGFGFGVIILWEIIKNKLFR